MAMQETIRNATSPHPVTGEVCPVPHQGQINIKLIAKQYEQEGFPTLPTASALNARYKEFPEQKPIDLYALSVPIVDTVITSAREKRAKRPPLGLLDATGNTLSSDNLGFDPYATIRKAMQRTLQDENQEYFFNPTIVAERNAASPHAKENHAIFSLLSRNHTGEEDPSTFIERGIVTGANIMPEALRLIPRLYENVFHKSPNPESATQIARDNYPFLSRLAIAHLVSFVRITNKVGGRNRPFDPRFFTLDQNEHTKSGLQITFTTETRKQIEADYHAWINDPVEGYRRRLGCVAIHSEALRNLWDWHSDISTIVYEQSLKTTHNLFPSTK